MYFKANLKVVINGQDLRTVVSVKTSNDASKVGSSCELTVPLNCYLKYKNQNDITEYLTSVRADTFPQGAPVEIIASYNDGHGNKMPDVSVFKGFVYDFVLGTPTVIKCLDYVYFFNLGVFGEKRVTTTNKKGEIKNTGKGVHYKSITLKDLLHQLIDFVNEKIVENAPSYTLPVGLILPTVEMTFLNLTFILMSPAAILEWLKEQLGLNITFYNNGLYCNYASVTTGTVKLDTSRNVLKASLQTTLQSTVNQNGTPIKTSKPSAFQRIRMKCWFIREDGTRDSLEIGDSDGIQYEHFFYKVKRSTGLYEKLADAALLKAQQHHYRGALELLLYPTLDLFWEVIYNDVRYPERSGKYYIIGTSFELNEKGFHQKIKVAYLTALSYLNSKGQLITS